MLRLVFLNTKHVKRSSEAKRFVTTFEISRVVVGLVELTERLFSCVGMTVCKHKPQTIMLLMCIVHVVPNQGSSHCLGHVKSVISLLL